MDTQRTLRDVATALRGLADVLDGLAAAAPWLAQESDDAQSPGA